MDCSVGWRFSQSVNKYSMNAPMIEWMDEKKKEWKMIKWSKHLKKEDVGKWRNRVDNKSDWLIEWVKMNKGMNRKVDKWMDGWTGGMMAEIVSTLRQRNKKIAQPDISVTQTSLSFSNLDLPRLINFNGMLFFKVVQLNFFFNNYIVQ